MVDVSTVVAVVTRTVVSSLMWERGAWACVVECRWAGSRRQSQVGEHATTVGVHEGSVGVGLKDLGGDEGVDFEGGFVAQHHLVVHS